MIFAHRRYLHLLARGARLTATQRLRLDTHLAVCAACRARAEAYDRQTRFLQALAIPEMPRSVEGQVLARLGAIPIPAPTHSSFRPATFGAIPGRTAAALLLPLALVLLVTIGYAAGSIIRVHRPEDSANLSRTLFVPNLPPYQTVRYRTLDPRQAAQQSGYAVAYLTNAAPLVNPSVGVDIFPHAGWPRQASSSGPRQGLIAVAIRSVVRYRGNGHTIIVALDEPSPAALRRDLILGEHTVYLANGQAAWASDDVSGALPFVRPRRGPAHELAWPVDRYVVAVFSDLPAARLRALALHVAVVPPRPNPAQRGIPAAWPTPLPLDPLPARLQVVVTGSATYRRHGDTLDISYLFNTGSYSQGALWGLDKWHDVTIVLHFPPALQQRARGLDRRLHFSGGGFGFGGTGSVRVRGIGAAALNRSVRQGVTVRLTWLEGKQRRHQTFHFGLKPAAR